MSDHAAHVAPDRFHEDELLRDRVIAALREDALGIDISVHEATVILAGTVEDDALRDELDTRAFLVPGVKAVENRLQIVNATGVA
ncbi:MAG TPA: BON domain-containing protein [Kofleriaceae bacterium]|nr:BON domain-containing protein [Kofleriaceae bacterium]